MFEKYSISKDAIYSLLIVIIITLLSIYSPINFILFSLKDITGIMIGLFGSLIGFVITAITILFMFDYKKSEILAKIHSAGLYKQIFERYLSSLKVLVFSLIIFILLDIVSTPFLEQDIIKMSLNAIVIFLVTLSMWRIYRNIRLLKKILDVI